MFYLSKQVSLVEITYSRENYLMYWFKRDWLTNIEDWKKQFSSMFLLYKFQGSETGETSRESQ